MTTQEQMRKDFESLINFSNYPEGYLAKDENGEYVDDDAYTAFSWYQAGRAHQVPAGFAIVPIEPQPGQVAMGRLALFKASDSEIDATSGEIMHVYREMIAAAPKGIEE